MPIATPLDRDQCSDILAPHLEPLDACFTTAWRRWTEWLAKLDGSPTAVTARTRASALHDLIASEVVDRFTGTPGVKVEKRRGLVVLKIGDKIVIRFKKFRSKSLRVATNSTRQTAAFAAQQLELTDQLLQPMTHLVAGYLLDRLESGVQTVAVTCSVDGEHFWAPIEVKPTEARSLAPVVQAQTQPNDPTIQKPGVRTRGKPAVRRQDEGG